MRVRQNIKLVRARGRHQAAHDTSQRQLADLKSLLRETNVMIMHPYGIAKLRVLAAQAPPLRFESRPRLHVPIDTLIALPRMHMSAHLCRRRIDEQLCNVPPLVLGYELKYADEVFHFLKKAKLLSDLPVLATDQQTPRGSSETIPTSRKINIGAPVRGEHQ